MNPRAIALLMLVACANALLDGKPGNDSQTFDIEKSIADGIKTIKDIGLDPYINEGDFYHISLNHTLFGELEIVGNFHNFELIGLSDIIYDVRYEQDEYVIDLRFPRLKSTIGIAALNAWYQGSIYEIRFDGWFAVNDIAIIVRVKSVSSELSDEDYKFEFGLGSIESKMNMVIGGNDISEIFNDFMETSIPYLLKVYQEELNNIISYFVLELPEQLKR